jgi:hypothetical protein
MIGSMGITRCYMVMGCRRWYLSIFVPCRPGWGSAQPWVDGMVGGKYHLLLTGREKGESMICRSLVECYVSHGPYLRKSMMAPLARKASDNFLPESFYGQSTFDQAYVQVRGHGGGEKLE